MVTNNPAVGPSLFVMAGCKRPLCWSWLVASNHSVAPGWSPGTTLLVLAGRQQPLCWSWLVASDHSVAPGWSPATLQKVRLFCGCAVAVHWCSRPSRRDLCVISSDKGVRRVPPLRVVTSSVVAVSTETCFRAFGPDSSRLKPRAPLSVTRLPIPATANPSRTSERRWRASQDAVHL